MKSRQGGWLGYLSEVRVGFVMMAAALVIFLANFPFIETLSQKILDQNFKKRGIVQGEKQVIIAAIDEKSLEKFGRWPWSRAVWVDIIGRLTVFKPAVIGLDIVFDSPEIRSDFLLAKDLLGKMEKTGISGELQDTVKQAVEQADVDSRLARAFRESGVVVPGYFFFTTPDEVANLKLDPDTEYKIIRKSTFRSIKLPKKWRKEFYSGKKEFRLKTGLGAKPNIKPLTDSAALTGFFNIFPDEDGVARRMTNVMRFHNKYFPSLTMQMLSVYGGGAHARLVFGEADKTYQEEEGVVGLYVGDTEISSDLYGRTTINYYGPERSFEQVSLADIMPGGLPDERLEEILKDRIVFVGATAIGIYDIRHTPFGIMPGVEIQATFIQNVLDGKLLKTSGWFIRNVFNTGSILGIGLLFILVMRRLSIYLAGLLAIGLGYSYYRFQLYMFISHYTMLDVLYPVIAIILVYGGIAFYKYAVEAGERRFIKKAFGHYISPQVVEQLIADPGKLELGGQEKVMTAIFTDIKGFSSFSEKMGPHDLVELLNEYLTEMTTIIMANKGTLDKYIGDAIVAFFGAPLDDEEHAVNACKAALESQRRLAQMREKWRERNLPPLEVRIGLNTGEMLVGNMGSDKTFNYTMMGDEVNLAARLEGVNKQYGTSICISENTLRATDGQFETRELDLVKVVGRETPVRLYELLALKGGLTKEQEEWRAAFAHALEIYNSQKWEEAMGEFEEVARLHDDGAARNYARRCRRFLELPPGTEWDGIFTLTSK